MRLMSRRLVLTAAMFMLIAVPTYAQRAPAVLLSRWEVAPSITVNRDHASQSAGAGLDLSAAINLGERAALVGDVTHEFRGVTSLAAGGRISTGFFDPGAGDGIPGRFFARALAGTESGDMGARFVLLLGAGSDVVIPAGVRGVTLHLGLDYRLTPAQSSPPNGHFAGWRVVIGTVFGPRLAPQARGPGQDHP
jgi:hypothetical protein